VTIFGRYDASSSVLAGASFPLRDGFRFFGKCSTVLNARRVERNQKAATLVAPARAMLVYRRRA